LRTLTARFTAVCLALACFSVSVHAGVIVGTDNQTNCLPFGCINSLSVVEMQQVYSSSAFSGPISIGSFSVFADPAYQTSLEDATIAVYFSTTSAAVNGLSTDLATNIGADNSLFGTYTLTGPSPSTLTFTGTAFNYDPGAGNLLMDIVVTSGGATGDYDGFQADSSGVVTSRAYNS
jgi:hypothetical protein